MQLKVGHFLLSTGHYWKVVECGSEQLRDQYLVHQPTGLTIALRPYALFNDCASVPDAALESRHLAAFNAYLQLQAWGPAESFKDRWYRVVRGIAIMATTVSVGNDASVREWFACIHRDWINAALPIGRHSADEFDADVVDLLTRARVAE